MSNNKMFNIGGDPNDPSYRYKMHGLKTKVEGRGNGIKTVLTNVTIVSDELHTDPSYITRFFGVECGAGSKFDTQRNVAIVNGKHDRREIQKKLNRFIRDFILCPQCGLPELKSKIKEKQLKHQCKACSWQGTNKSSHKVKDFIIKNPTKWIKTKSAKSEKDGKSKRHKQDRKSKSQQSDRDGKQHSEQKEDGDPNYNDIGGEDDEVWSVDASLEAVAARKQQEMERLAKKGNYREKREEKKDDGDHRGSSSSVADSAIQILKAYMNSSERDYGEILDEVKRISLARNYDLRKTIELVLDTLCDWKHGLNECLEGLKKYSMIFRKYTKNKQDAQVFIAVIENYIFKRDLDDEFENKVYKLLEGLYDAEILDEEDLLYWADIPVDKAMFVESDDAEKIRRKAAVFINWLRENDEEDDDEDDDEDEDDEHEEGQ